MPVLENLLGYILYSVLSSNHHKWLRHWNGLFSCQSKPRWLTTVTTVTTLTRATRAGFVFQSPHRTTQMASVWQIQTVHAFHSHLSLFSCVCICICTRTLYIKFHFAPFPLPIVVLKRILGGDVMFFTSTSSPLHWVELRKSWTVLHRQFYVIQCLWSRYLST